VIATEEGFLDFVKKWAAWLEGFPADGRLVFGSEVD
jgi:hypothetical protein